MRITSVSQCNKRLNFEPLRIWPDSWPAFAWNGFLITAFERHDGPALEMQNGSGGDLTSLLIGCYESLSLSEVARLFVAWPREIGELQLDWPHLLQHYKLRDSERLRQTLTLLAQTPRRFQDWVSEKGLGPRDLSILNNFPQPVDLQPALDFISQGLFSKSVGVQALELAGELRMMGHEWDTLIPDQQIQPERWLHDLQGKRQPIASQQMRDKEEHVRRLPWPSQVQAHWRRQGDEAGIEIRFLAKSAKDLEKKLQGLMQLQPRLTDSEESLWNH